MEARHRCSEARAYVDFQPLYRWTPCKTFDTLEVKLPGFKREQIKVQLRTTGTMKIYGECLLDNCSCKCLRFSMEFVISDVCKHDCVTAKFDDETLRVTMPKILTQAKGPHQCETACELVIRDADECRGSFPFGWKEPTSTNSTLVTMLAVASVTALVICFTQNVYCYWKN